MKHATLIALLPILLLASCGGEEKPSAPDPKTGKFNVILISADTLRADRLGCYGYDKRRSSPTLDAMASEGIVFENLITTSPWTTPAHLSMLTSLYPSTHGLTSSFIDMWSALFGKGDFFKLPAHRVTLAEVLKTSGFKTVAFTAGGPVDPDIGFDQGFEHYGTAMFKLRHENMDEMFKWIRDNSREQFFLFWHHFEVHAPYLNTDFVTDVLPNDKGKAVTGQMNHIADISLASVWPTGASKLRKKQRAVLKNNDVFNMDVCESLYVGGVLKQDRWLAKLVKLLKKEGLYDNTMLVFTSDHGEELGDHNPKLFYNVHGHTLYEEMIHVPLVIKLPKQYASGTRIGDPVSTVDIMPTILDFLEVTPKKNQMQGISLKPYWMGAKPESKRPGVFTEAMARKEEKKSIRTDRYKYIITIGKESVEKHGRDFIPPDPARIELYDLKSDPRERKNLLAGEHDARTNRLAAGFDSMVRAHQESLEGEAEKTTLDKDTVEKLKGLGYMGEH